MSLTVSNLVRSLCSQAPSTEERKEKGKTMRKNTVAFALILLFLISAHYDGVEAQGVNCYDSCNTGCVNPDVRLYLRCDRKCQIKCNPDLAAVAAGNRG